MIYSKFLSLDILYSRTTCSKVLLNDLAYFDKSTLVNISDLLTTTYETDVLSTLPTCDCGDKKGTYLTGKVCTICGTDVKDPFERIEPNIWMRSLDQDQLFISPEYWLMVRKILGKNLDALRWLSDTSYNPPKEIPNWLRDAEKLIGGRFYSNLIDKFEDVLTLILSYSSFRIKKPAVKELEDAIILYRENKDRILSRYLPIPNKRLFVVEKTSKGVFTNLMLSGVLDLVLTFIKAAGETKTVRRRSNIMGSTISNLASLYDEIYKEFLAKKGGMLRKHVYGTRSHFTFRAVIVSKTGPHNYDEIDVPWNIGVTAFRPHLLNKLRQKGIPYRKSDPMLFAAVNHYNPIIDECLRELIAESSDSRGIPILLARNPSLLQGSIQKVYISRFKIDPGDNTMAMSTLIMPAPNADVDGDELNVTILLDNLMAENTDSLSPHFNVTDLTKQYSVSGNLSVMSPATATISNYLSVDD